MQDIFDLCVEMFRDYTTKMQGINRSQVYSLPVSKAISYVKGHLHESITLPISLKPAPARHPLLIAMHITQGIGHKHNRDLARI